MGNSSGKAALDMHSKHFEQTSLFQLEGTYKNHLWSNSGLTKSESMLLRTLSKWLLNTDRLGASTASLGSLFQAFGQPLSKEFLSAIQSEPPLIHP